MSESVHNLVSQRRAKDAQQPAVDSYRVSPHTISCSHQITLGTGIQKPKSHSRQSITACLIRLSIGTLVVDVIFEELENLTGCPGVSTYLALVAPCYPNGCESTRNTAFSCRLP